MLKALINYVPKPRPSSARFLAATGAKVNAQFQVDIPIGQLGNITFHVVGVLDGVDSVPPLVGNDALKGKNFQMIYDECCFWLSGTQHQFSWSGGVPVYNLLPRGDGVKEHVHGWEELQHTLYAG